MNIDVATKSDLISLENNLIQKMEKLIKGNDNFTETTKKFYTTRDFETLFGVSKAKQQQLRNANRLIFTKIGSTIYYPIKEVEKLLEENKSV
jgi:hypothetical protein